MKNLLLLIDFTELSILSLEHALMLAKLNNSSLIFCHITDVNTEKNNNDINENFKPYLLKANEAGINHQTHIAYGSLINCAREVVARLKPDLVVVGTHGKHGILQHLFGSKIFNLVKELASPVLVVNNQSKLAENGFKKILIPVSLHDTYLQMLEKSINLLDKNGKIIIFAVVKYGIPLDNEITKNAQLAQTFLNQKGIENEYLEIVSDQYSAGYSKATLQYVKNQEIDLITIITKVSTQNNSFASVDKENIMLNEAGLAVLCVDC